MISDDIENLRKVLALGSEMPSPFLDSMASLIARLGFLEAAHKDATDALEEISKLKHGIVPNEIAREALRRIKQ